MGRTRSNGLAGRGESAARDKGLLDEPVADEEAMGYAASGAASSRKRRRNRVTQRYSHPDGDLLDAGSEDESVDEVHPRSLPAPCLDGVVKIFCSHTGPHYSLPWQVRRQTTSTSTGCVISNGRILTNAHCVENYSVVKVKRRGDPTKFVAEVLAIGRECDLALLTVKDPLFWRGAHPIAFSSLPQLQELVTVVGFPVGGDNLSITQGVVSRVDMQEYVHGCTELLAVQIDAAINSGNSGGPAFSSQGTCVGIAFQSLKDGQTENIGYVIPTCVVEHFLEDFARDGKYSGFCDLGVELQNCENKSLRAHCGLKARESGVMVRRVHPVAAAPAAAAAAPTAAAKAAGAAAAGLGGASAKKSSGAASASRPVTEQATSLAQGDVLMSFDGVPIANDGTVDFRSGERIALTWLVSQKHIGDRATLRVRRGGATLNIDVTLGGVALLVPVESSLRKPRATDLRVPSYAIVGGLVFVPLCEPYLRSEYGDDFDAKAPIALLERWQYGICERPDDQVVVLSQVLAHEINVGYEHLVNQIVSSVNGQRVRTLRCLTEIVDASRERFLRIDLAPQGEVVVLETNELRTATNDILSAHNISSARSSDLV